MTASKVRTILFDMDGVAADWKHTMLQFIFNRYGIEVASDGYNKHPAADRWASEMYSECPRLFRELPLIERFPALFKGTQEMAADLSVTIGWLSAVDMRHQWPHFVMADKLYWLGETLGMDALATLPHARFVYGSPAKVAHAAPDVLLVEDYPKNSRAFIEAGGKSVLLDSEDGMYDVEKALNEIKAHLE